MLKNKLFIIFVSFVLSWSISFAGSLSEVEGLILNEEYTDAYKMLEELNDNTKEAFYLKGLCMYYLNTELDDAIVLLTKSLSAGGPERVKLVLGMIYHRKYQFSESQRLLKDFLPHAKNQSDKDLALLYIRFCQNANAVIHRGKQISVLSNTKVEKSQIPVKYNEQDIAGIIVPKSYNLNSKEDERNAGENMMMVLPKDAETVKYVYYSAYVAGRPDHIDIFRVKVLDNGEFSEPDNLGGVINTAQDELYPYFDHENQILYFASMGHQSIGGFDIFMSYYNVGAESWSKPINLGLPYNSTSDDYLYIPMENNNEFLFSTKRNSSYNNVDIVKTMVSPGATYKTLVQIEDVIDFNKLTIGIVSTSSNNSVSGSTTDPKNDMIYKMLVKKALNYQVRADSVKRRVHEQEQKIQVALGESRKMQLTSDLKLMQEEYRILKQQADLNYEAVREYELKNGIKSVQVSENIEPEKNGIIVYEHPVDEANNGENEIEEVVEKTVVPVQKVEVKKPVTLPMEIKNYESSDDLPYGVVYTVQIGVYSKKVDKSNFSDLDNVFYYFISGRNLYKYYTGVFQDIDGARSTVKRARAAGYPDAFIAAFRDKQPVSLENANKK